MGVLCPGTSSVSQMNNGLATGAMAVIAGGTVVILNATLQR